MTLGNILSEAAVKDLAGANKNKVVYTESVKGELFKIKMTSIFEEAAIECSIPYTGKEEEKNYLRIYFLSMVFNAAIHGMKRMKHTKNKKR